MHTGLASRRANIDTDVVAIGRVLPLNELLRIAEKRQDRGVFRGSHIEETCDMAPRDDEHVSAAKRIAVVTDISQRIRKQHCGRHA